MDDQQQDANTALLELDKGLRAQKVGQQCEAIVRFPCLFERFPFPILINSAFLKLADVFRDGNNFLRLCIVRVARQSHHHLDKVVNVSEFRKRISVVIHSNDPYARAITLRMFGSIACIISDEKGVHHSIRQGLDSHDLVEQEAAVFATLQFSSHSEEFAKSICNKIATMLQGLSTPLEVKLKIIPVLQNMYHNVEVSSRSREVLKELLPVYPAEEFVVATLNTLTNLSVRSLVDIPSQIGLLLQHLRCDPREAIKIVTLQNLNILAEVAPHLWTSADAAELCKAYTIVTMRSPLQSAILNVLCTLMNGETITHLIDDGDNIVDLCRRCFCHEDLRQAALATKLFVFVAANTPSNEQSTSASVALLNECADCMESLLLLLAPMCEHSKRDQSTFKILLPALHKLCRASNTSIVNSLFKVVLELVTECQSDNELTLMFLEILVSVSIKRSEDLLSPFSFNLLHLLSSAVSTADKHTSKVFQRIITHLCTLLFISNFPHYDQKIGGKITKLLISENSSANKWTWYRVARQATRLGEHKVASEIFRLLAFDVVSERYYYWLRALHEFEQAESCLLPIATSTIDSIDHAALFRASQLYQDGLTSLNAAVSPEHQLTFQLIFAKLRSMIFLAHSHLIMVCRQMQISPPPNVDEPQQITIGPATNGVLRTQLKECRNDFLNIADKYGKLHLSSFDADPSSLQNLDMLQHTSSVMAHVIDFIINMKGQEPSTMQRSNLFNLDVFSRDEAFINKALSKAIKGIVSEVEKMPVNSSSQGLNNYHTDCLMKCSALLLAVPHSFPRYFYQSLQTTTIKLALSPSQRSPNEPVSLDVNEQLALKIEGVIRHGGTGGAILENENVAVSGNHNFSYQQRNSKSKTFRRISEITITVTSSHAGGKHQSHGLSKIPEHLKSCLEQTVKPHNNYFQVQFLLSIPVVGTHNLIIECSLIDEKGARWRCGPTENLTVKCADDSIRIKSAMLHSHQASLR